MAKHGKKAKGITVSSYRIWWDYENRKGTIRIYDAAGKFIDTGNVTFADLAQMREFISLFLARDVSIAFLPDAPDSPKQLESGPFPIGRQK